MLIQAKLNNRERPELGEVTIDFPIPESEYARCLELLAPLGIDDPVEPRCHVAEIQSGYKTLSRLEGTLVNMDELDFLAKRLDSFCDGEDDQFEGMAHLLGLREVKDFINLTFCCQGATVISDFSNLKDIGQTHYLNTHGGGAPVDVLRNLDAEKIARDLIASGQGHITPYGVVYDNNLKLEPCYWGNVFPPYLYQPKVMDLEIESLIEDWETTVLQLPMPRQQLERMLLRGGINPEDDLALQVISESCPGEVFKIMQQQDFQESTWESIQELNRMCKAIEQLTVSEMRKLDAVVAYVQPEYPFQIQHLAENLDQFDFVPNVKTPAEYGRWMIGQSGRFDYDPELEAYYDFEKYGNDHIAWQEGSFTAHGYVSYQGTMSIDELMMEDPSDPEQETGMQMGGMT